MSVKKELEYFANEVINRSRSNLTQKKKNASKELYNSLKYDIKVSNKNSFTLSFSMENYGTFIDKGVKGRDSSLKAPNSPYQFKNKMPPSKVLDKWVIRKGLKGIRNKKGQFVSRESLKFAIAKNIQKYGLETTNFFTKPFENAFKRLPEDIVKAYALEVEDFFKFTLK
jgi:hypothetical protein